MTTADLCQLSLVELAGQIARRDVASAEVIEAALARLERVEPRLNAFITVLPDQARLQARQADEEIAAGRYRGPLHGVPVTVKDLFWTAGARTTGGSKILADWVPDVDAAVVERLKAAGAILLGKTNTDELGHGGTGTVSHFGPMHNPWHLDHITGGSSGGSCAAVAAGIGPLSYGTETAASVRRPAGYCGVVGVKPTFGVISRHGSFRTAWSMDHAGVFGRSVADAAIGLDAVAGYDPRDPGSVRLGDHSYSAALQPSRRGVRVGVVRRAVEDEGMDPVVQSAFDLALQALAGLGAEVREIEVPELRYVGMTHLLISNAEAAAQEGHWMRERAQDFVDRVRRFNAAGMTLSASEYLTAQRARQRIREAVQAAYEEVDLIVAPTQSRPAPLISEGHDSTGDRPFEVGYNHVGLMRLPSLLGLPACSIPCGLTPAGLPLGVQLIGYWFEDQAMLNAAAAYEQVSGWAGRQAPIAQQCD